MADEPQPITRSIDPRSYQKIVGSTFANRDHLPLIQIGNNTWNKWELGRLGCPHPGAAVRVNRVIKTLGIRTVKDFIEKAPDFGRFKDLGVTCYWVVLALVHDLGKDVEAVHGEDRSFNSIHSQALRLQAGAEKPRKRARSRR